MAWRLKINGEDLVKEVDDNYFNYNIKYEGLNDSDDAIIYSFNVSYRGYSQHSGPDRYTVNITTCDKEAILWFSIRGDSEKIEIDHQSEKSIFTIDQLTEQGLAALFISIRKEVDPSISQFMSTFYNRKKFTIPISIKLDSLIQLIDSGKYSDAIKSALTLQKDERNTLIQFGRILENAYSKNKASISHVQIIQFYLSLGAEYRHYNDAMKALFAFCQSIDNSQMVAEEKIRLLEYRFHAALIIKDPVASRYYQELSGASMAEPIILQFNFDATPEAKVIVAFIDQAREVRKMREQFAVLKKTGSSSSLAQFSAVAASKTSSVVEKQTLEFKSA